MVSKVEHDASHDMLQFKGQSFPPKFIESRNGKKLLVLDGYIFHLNTKNKTTGYFKCSQTRKGCGARIVLKNWNQNEYSFDGYEITNGRHLNHLPDFDKIKRKTIKVQLEKAQDLKSPEFQKSKHVCLFCLSSLPANYHLNTNLENVVPHSGKKLGIVLDNPTKNSQAFDLICSLLNIKWRRYQEGRTFDQTVTLPLCLNCQNLYQEVFQLHVQIRELEILINKRIKVITDIVKRSGDNEGTDDDTGQTQLSFLGLDVFRRKVRDESYNKFGCDAQENVKHSTSTNTTSLPPLSRVNTTTTTAITKVEPEVDDVTEDIQIPASSSTQEQPIVKQEVNPEEEHFEDSCIDSISLPFDEIAQETLDDNEPYTAYSDADDEDDLMENDSDLDTATQSPTPKILKKTTPYSTRSSSSSLSRSLRYRKPTVTTNTYSKPSRQYKCNICSTILIGHKQFDQHIKKDHPGRVSRYSCKFCNRIFPSLYKVTIHQHTHTGEKPFKCPHCRFATSHPDALTTHITNKHTICQPSIPCPQCPKTFPSRSALSSHMYIHSESLSFCKTCGTSFRFKCQFTMHNQKVHKGTAEISPPIKELENLEDTLENLGIKPKLNRCHVCWGTIIGGRYFIQKHFDTCHPTHQGGLYTCQCGKKFINYWRTVEHAKRHSKERKEFQCDQCPHKSYTGAGLNRHKETHVPVEKRKGNHICDKCGLGMASETGLWQHRKLHDGEKRKWICDLCGKMFREKRVLDEHRKSIHLKILPWKCDKCEKAFRTRSTLRRHESCHLGFKKFRCEVCEGLAFVHKASMVRHMREVHEEGGGKMGRKRKTEMRRKRGGVEAENDNKN